MPVIYRVEGLSLRREVCERAALGQILSTWGMAHEVWPPIQLLMVACSMRPAVACLAWVSMRAGDAEDLPPALLPPNAYETLGATDHSSSYTLRCLPHHPCFSLLGRVYGW